MTKRKRRHSGFKLDPFTVVEKNVNRLSFAGLKSMALLSTMITLHFLSCCSGYGEARSVMTSQLLSIFRPAGCADCLWTGLENPAPTKWAELLVNQQVWRKILKRKKDIHHPSFIRTLHKSEKPRRCLLDEIKRYITHRILWGTEQHTLPFSMNLFKIPSGQICPEHYPAPTQFAVKKDKCQRNILILLQNHHYERKKNLISLIT